MAEKLSIDVRKLFRKYEKSVERSKGIEISSDIRGLKYILKGDSLVLSTIEHGVFAIALSSIDNLVGELMDIGEMYDLPDSSS